MEERSCGAISAAPQAGPTPLFSSGDQSSTKGISFDIAADSKQVLVILDRNGMVAILIDRSCAARSVERVPTHCMGARQPMHELGKCVIRWPYDQMPVVRHGTICQQPHGHALHGLHKHTFKRRVVQRRFEELRASNRTVYNVIDKAAGYAA
jgi:hypothetical protein